MKKNLCVRFLLFAFYISLFTLFGCAEMFQDKIDMDFGSQGGISLGDMFYNDEEGPLPTPQDLQVSQDLSSSKIYVTWQPVRGALTYRIDRAKISKDSEGNFPAGEPDESEYETIVMSLYNATSYEDTILATPGSISSEYDNRYYYRVQASNVRSDRDDSDFSNAKYGTLFAVPTNVEADKGVSSTEINLSWDRVKGAVSYKIYRSRNEDGTSAELRGTQVANTLVFKDTVNSSDQGIDFYYTVAAVNNQNAESAKSVIAPGYSLMAGAPKQVPDVKVNARATTKSEGISLNWGRVSADGELKYYIYRTSSKDASYRLLGNVDASTTSYKDTKNLEEGVYYYYQIQPRVTKDGVELKGPYSDNSTINCQGFLLSAPSEVSVEKTGNSVTFQWSQAIGSEKEQNQYGYKIYGDNSQDGSFLKEVANVTVAGCTKNGNYLRYQVNNASDKFYRIATRHESKESGKSAVTAPAPSAATNVSATDAENVGGSANTNGVYPVKITWSAPANGDTPSGYHVYRSTKNDGTGFTRITDAPVTALEYMDADTAGAVKAGKYYYYRVLSLNELKQGANYSNIDSGYGALTHLQYFREYNKTIVSSQKKMSLMHKGGLGALGSESKGGNFGGTLSYNASGGLGGADITMHYESYVDFNIDGNKALGPYFKLTGNSDTKITNVTSQSGNMHGTVNCEGMYPGSVDYGGIQINGGNASGGTYRVTPRGFSSATVPWNAN